MREYLDLARVEGGELQVSMQCGVPFVEKVVEPALELVRPADRGGRHDPLDRAAATHARRFTVDCDPSLLTIVLVNLLGNAVHYGRPGGGLRLTVAPSRAPPARRGLERRTGLFAGRTRPPVSQVLAPAHPDEPTNGGAPAWACTIRGGSCSSTTATFEPTPKPGEWAEFTFEIPQPLCAADVADELEPSE